MVGAARLIGEEGLEQGFSLPEYRFQERLWSFLFGDVQKLPGYRPRQSTLGGLAQLKRVGPDGPRGPLQPQPFWDFVRIQEKISHQEQPRMLTQMGCAFQISYHNMQCYCSK